MYVDEDRSQIVVVSVFVRGGAGRDRFKEKDAVVLGIVLSLGTSIDWCMTYLIARIVQKVDTLVDLSQLPSWCRFERGIIFRNVIDRIVQRNLQPLS